MKIFISGATGFIGSALTSRLVSLGYELHVLSRDPSRKRMFSHSSIVFFTGDILDPETVRNAMTGCDRVFHLAAFAKVWAGDPGIYYRFNVEGTENVLRTALELGVKKMVNTSTAGVLGPSEGSPVTENTVRTLGFFTGYERTKYEADRRVEEMAGRGMAIVTVYPTRVFGPGPLNQSNSATRLIRRYAVGRWRILPGNGNRIGNYVYIDDLVEGMILAMEKGKEGEKYILGGSDVSYRDFFETVARVCGRRYRMIRIPLLPAIWISALFSAFAKITGRPPLITPGWVKKYLHDWSSSSRKAITELGYAPEPFEEGIRKTVRWLAVNHP